jgi:hypothetical protein
MMMQWELECMMNKKYCNSDKLYQNAEPSYSAALTKLQPRGCNIQTMTTKQPKHRLANHPTTLQYMLQNETTNKKDAPCVSISRTKVSDLEPRTVS